MSEAQLLSINIANTDLSQKKTRIVIPVHNALEDLDLCLQSVFEFTTANTELFIIDDASTEPLIYEKLMSYANLGNIIVKKNESNLGFARCVDEAIKSSANDVILLNSDTIVGPRWVENLLTAAYQRSSIGTVTALSNNAGAFSAPILGMVNDLPSSLSKADAARIIMHSALPSFPTVGTGNGFCMFIRQSCYLETGGFDLKNFGAGYGEENDFCVRASRLGWEHVIDDRTYVFHKREASFGERSASLKTVAKDKLQKFHPEYASITNSFSERTDLKDMRARIDNALNDKTPAFKPRVLFVISTLTGGTPKTNNDLMAALSQYLDPYLLVCDRTKISVFSVNGGKKELLSSYVLNSPIDPLTHTSAEYDEFVSRMLFQLCIELVHIRHLAWHSLSLPKVCNRLGIPSVFSFHDFYMICPSVKLLDERSVRCNGRCTETPGECSVELWSKSSMPPLKNGFIRRWKERSLLALSHCDAFVTTANSTRQIIVSNFPTLSGRIHVIPHGRDFKSYVQRENIYDRNRPFRVLLAGSLSFAKGSRFISEAAALMKDSGFEFHLLGQADVKLDRNLVKVHGSYDREAFLQMVDQISPDIGLIPSIWPETHCHVLSEMWAAGLPVLALDVGALGERIRAHGGGWLLETDDPRLLANALYSIREDVQGLREARTEVSNWQNFSAESLTTALMANQYLRVFESVFAMRRSFKAALNL